MLGQARVTVAEPLPLLKARLKAPPTCVSPGDDSPRPLRGEREEDKPEKTRLIALKGQVLCWELSVQNAGARSAGEFFRNRV